MTRSFINGPAEVHVAATKKTVLVVDDAGLVRLYYRSVLEQSGFQVEEALNGLEGVEKVLTMQPNLLVIDVNMPHMDGISFLDLLRRKPEPLCSIPALITSTECAEKDFEAARAAGANFYLVKPVSGEQLSEMAALMCGISR